jgi:hypothetical protein
MRPFNFHYVFVPSNVPGAPFASGAAPNDTAFKAHIADSGWLQADDAAADTAASAAPDVDGVVILVKFATGAPWERSNADVLPGQKSGRVRLSRDSGDALVHELGHAIVGLGDEYTEIDGPPPDDQKSALTMYPNLSLESTGARWKAVTSSVIEGAGRYTKGVWKSAEHCRMNESTSEDFCAVCQAEMAKPRHVPPPPAKVNVANGVATWAPGGETPTSWWIQIEETNGWFGPRTVVAKTYIEPQNTSYDVSRFPPGDYYVWVWAESMAGSAAGSYAKFSVSGTPTSGTPSPPSTTPGIAGVLPGS